MRHFGLFILLLLTSCSSKRDFTGSKFNNTNVETDLFDTPDARLENLYGVTKIDSGFQFFGTVALKNKDFYSSIKFTINTDLNTVTMNSIQLGQLNCSPYSGTQTTSTDAKENPSTFCQVHWLSSERYFSLDHNQLEIKILSQEHTAYANPSYTFNTETPVCSKSNSVEIKGQKHLVQIKDLKTSEILQIKFYDFGSEHQGSFFSSYAINKSAFYSIDLNLYFNNLAYAYNTYYFITDTYESVYQILATELETTPKSNQSSNITQICIFDKDFFLILDNEED